MKTNWVLQDYSATGTRVVGHTNAKAGPSTLRPPPGPFVGSPTPQPSGWLSETSAGAEQSYPTTEEEEAPVSGFYRPHIPRVVEWSFSVLNVRGRGRDRPNPQKKSGGRTSLRRKTWRPGSMPG
jgi:hypothetical protein